MLGDQTGGLLTVDEGSVDVSVAHADCVFDSMRDLLSHESASISCFRMIEGESVTLSRSDRQVPSPRGGMSLTVLEMPDSDWRAATGSRSPRRAMESIFSMAIMMNLSSIQWN